MDTVLKTTELTKVFSGKKAVDHVSMTVNRGDIYGFIGKNGAGKTTLIRMAVGARSSQRREHRAFRQQGLDADEEKGRYGN